MKCAQLGLPDDDLPMLTGFTTPAFAALAHLRDAWCQADSSNRGAIEAALRVLMTGHSFADHVDWVARILSYRLDYELGDEICAAAGPEVLRALALERAYAGAVR